MCKKALDLPLAVNYLLIAVFYKRIFCFDEAVVLKHPFKLTNCMKKNLLLLFMFFCLTTTLALAQDRTITGKVVDKDGQPVPGATVIVKGTTTGASTKADGTFSLNVPSNATLIISFIGMATQEIIVGSQSQITVTMKDENSLLDEIVVTGLASNVKRSNLANAVSSISAKELVGITSPPTFDGALYGKLTGANIVKTSGAPGGGIAIRLRGISSIVGQNQPLFIVDGVYLDNSEIPSGIRFASGANAGNEEQASNRIADLSSFDIERVEVLKGASAAAIYGSRANAGVVIITTKKGNAGKTRFNFEQLVGTARAIKLLGQRNYDTEAKVRGFFDETTPAGVAAADAEVAKWNAARNGGGLYDYEKEVYGNVGGIFQTNLSASGGSNRTTFYTSASIRNEEGIIRGTGYRRRNFRLNLTHKLSKYLKITTGSYFVNSVADRSFTGNENEGGLSYGYNLAFTRPWNNQFPNERGEYPDNPTASGNPLFVRDAMYNREEVFRTIQSLNLEFNLLQRDNMLLQFNFGGGIDIFKHGTFTFVSPQHQAQRGITNGFLSEGANTVTNGNYQGAFVYNLNLGTTDLTSQLGFTNIYINRDFLLSRGTQLKPDQFNIQQAGAQAVDQALAQEQDFGYFFQQEANFNNRVILSAGVRLDKSTLNGDPNKLYAFPKASVAVNVANFDFWTLKETVNQVKVRAAFGQTGSSPGFGSLFTGFNNVNIGGLSGTTISGVRGNRNLEPEIATEIEAGIDLGFFGNRFFLEATYYTRNVRNLLIQRALPSSSGFASEISDAADLVNRGFELSLGGDLFTKENFAWTSQLRFWFNRSEITRLDVPAFAPAGTAFGLGLGTFYIEQGQSVTQFKGTDADGNIVTVGDALPDYQVSWNNTMRIMKNFELSFLWHYSKGGNNLNLSLFLTDLGRTSFDYDTPEGEARRNSTGSARYLEDATYLRLREVALFYNLPKNWIKNFSQGTIENVKVGISAQNWITITDYKWYDPEVSTKGGGGLSSGVDVAPFPSSKRIFFHLSATF